MSIFVYISGRILTCTPPSSTILVYNSRLGIPTHTQTYGTVDAVRHTLGRSLAATAAPAGPLAAGAR